MRDKSYKIYKNTMSKKMIAFGLSLAMLVGGSIAYGVGTHRILLPNSSRNTSYSTFSDNEPISTTENTSMNEDNNTTSMNETLYTDDDKVFEVSKNKDTYINQSYDDFYVNFKQSDLNEFKNYLKNIDNEYEYEDLYLVEEAYNKYKNINFSSVSNSGSIISGDVMYGYVIKNNNEYFSDKKNTESVIFSKLSKSDLKKICNEICESIKVRLYKSDLNVDIDKVNTLLRTMRIVSKNSSFDNVTYREDNLFIVNFKKIEDYGNINNIEDPFSEVIDHETGHILQKSADENLDDDTNQLGPFMENDNISVDSGYYTFLTEAAAELSMAKLLDIEPHTYTNPINYYNTLKYISTVGGKLNADEYDALFYEKNIEKVFVAFNAETKEEQLEIMKMFYSIEIMQTQPSDFYEAYKKYYGIDLNFNSDELEKLRLILRTDALDTMSKFYYKSLAIKAEEPLTINTIFYLIKLFEAKDFDHLHYNEKTRIQSGIEHFALYTDIQNHFFEMLANNTNYSFEEIVDMYEQYSMNVIKNEQNQKNYNINSFDKSTIEFFKETEEKKYFADIRSLRDMNEYCKTNDYSK